VLSIELGVEDYQTGGERRVLSDNVWSCAAAFEQREQAESPL
jgi:hypothetical protein